MYFVQENSIEILRQVVLRSNKMYSFPDSPKHCIDSHALLNFTTVHFVKLVNGMLQLFGLEQLQKIQNKIKEKSYKIWRSVYYLSCISDNSVEEEKVALGRCYASTGSKPTSVQDSNRYRRKAESPRQGLTDGKAQLTLFLHTY